MYLSLFSSERCQTYQCHFTVCLDIVFQTCDIKAEGRKRFLTLKSVKLDQAGEVSYQALNAVTSAMLTVKGTNPPHTDFVYTLFLLVLCWLLHFLVFGK